MSTKFIESWQPQHANDGIVGFTESQVLEPEPLCPGWMNLVCQRSVRAIAIAPKSRHLWMITWGGVLSWRQREESTYYRYSSEHGMAGNSVCCICIDERERPWVGHEEGGLSFFDENRWQVYNYFQREPIYALSASGNPESIWVATENAVYRVYVDEPERPPRLLISTHAGCACARALLPDADDLLLGNSSGLFRLKEDEAPSRLAAESINSCVALARDGEGRIWIGTPHSVHPCADGDVIGESVYDGQQGCVRSIATGTNRLWILSAEGISHVKDGTWQPISADAHTDAAQIQAIAASSNDNHLWVGTNHLLSSLYCSAEGVEWDHEMLPAHDEDELSNLGRCVAVSRASKKVFAGTAGGLVSCGDGDGWSLDSSAGDVRMLCVADDDQGGEAVWMLSSPLGINALGQDALTLPGIAVALAVGVDCRAYALTTRGLWSLGPKPTKLAEAAPWSTNSLAQTPDGVWWVGTSEGVYKHHDGRWRPVSQAPGPRLAEVYALAVIQNQVWAATSAGLWARTQNRWVSHNQDGPRLVRSLAPVAGAQKLWLAESDRVVRYDPLIGKVDQEFTTLRDGLASRRVTALAESDGYLWIVTQIGISRVKLTEGAGHD